MIKKLVVLLACFGLVHLSACTSNDQKSDAEVTSDFDSADLEKLDGEESMEMAGDSSLGSDQLPEDALGETTTTTTETTTTSTDMDMDTPAPEVAATESLPADPFAEQNTVESTPEPMMESTTVVDSSPTEPESTTVVESTTSTRSETTSSYSSDEEKPKKALPSLQKVATAPWKVGKVWYNTVYFARPGDNLSSISKMIYGKSNKVSELKKGNTMFQGRGVKPGDKVYYNSPHRSDDSGRMLTYYEDNGIAPETYVAKDGDDIKKISKNLLGYKDAWKEVWASNSVDSKNAIAAGTELRYWKGGAVAAAPAPEVHQEIAAAPPVQEMAPPAQEMPMDPMAGDMPPPPQQADNMDMPPPPQDPMAGQEMAPPPPPPDMAQEMAPPPPPPPVEAVNPPAPAHHEGGEEVAGIGGMDQDTTLALAVVGLAAAGLAILIVVRKKRRQKELEQHLDNTHVG